MTHLLSQLKYFKTSNQSFLDPLINWTQISITESGEKVKILYRQKHQSHWQYCIAPIIFNSILYTFLKIYQDKQILSFQSQYFIFQVDICIDTLKITEKNLFQNFSSKQLIAVIQSLSVFSLKTFSCQMKSNKINEKRLCFKFKTKNQPKIICDKIIKTSFFNFFVFIDRLKSYQKIKEQNILQSNSDMYRLRYLISTFRKIPSKNSNFSPVQAFALFKKQEKQITQHSSIITLQGKSLFDQIPYFSFSFSQNIQKTELLKKKYLEQHEKRKKIIKKEKIFSNIEIEKQQTFENFRIETKFSILTKCSLEFKIVQTHINRRHDFKKSTENIDYFNYLVSITKIQSTVCVRKKPFHKCLIQKSGEKNDKHSKDVIQLKEKSKRILKTQRNCLDIMKESLVANICPYYVHYNQQDTLYSKMYRVSLQQWRGSGVWYKDETILEIFLQILNGLHEMGQYKIIHRDLKPDNILIDDSDPLIPVVKLIDFGSTIYIHSDSQKYQQQVAKNFDPKLRTTKPYNIDFNEFRNLCCAYSPHNLYKYTESSYNRHANFDLHSVGKIIHDFLPKFENQQILNNLKFLINLCTCPDPQFRLNLQQTALFISTIKSLYFSK